MFKFNGNEGQLIGSYMSIGYGSVLKYLDLALSHESNTLGRLVTLAYWICDKDFDITNLQMDPTEPNGPRYCTSISASKATKISIMYKNENFYTRYANTNSIPGNTVDICRFNFDNEIDKNGLNVSKIFVALISTKYNTSTYDYKKATLQVCMDYGSTYIKDDIEKNNIRVDNNGGLYIVSSSFENPDGSTTSSEESTTVKPAKIECSDLRYRTWSDPENGFIIEPSNKTKRDNFNNKYTLAYVDGGNKASDVSEIDYKTLEYKYNNSTGEIRTHIFNKNEAFETDFCIPVGRLKDVVFDRPDIGAYDSKNSDIGASEARWVFKRSRIRFTIPPAMKNNKVVNKGIVLRYKIVTSMFDKSVYKSEYKTQTYSATAAANDIQLVICPRDEGVLDNMEFTVLLSRKYVGASNNQYSTEVAYKFHTYQKPMVNIASPKIIRNSATGDDFQYAKILTSNMYSNFIGEQAVVNKYVCDALTVMLSSSQRDASDIPTFVRFYLAEYKYGRDGRVKNNKVDTNFDTIQELYKSSDKSKYTSKTEILTGKFETGHECTANLTGIYADDGQPILFSGRFTKNTLNEVGEAYKLWTYKDWGYVNTSGDELVGNAWPVEVNGELYNSAVVGDHLGAPTKIYVNDVLTNVKQKVSKNILFRAGYIYLLRVRMFHGAAAGAIAKKIGTVSDESVKKKYKIIYGKENSGYYEYNGSIYSDKKEYPDMDISMHGQLMPYDGWLGPEDGTSGEALFKNANNYNTRLAQTYSGFSEVDYTLIEPVCPYTSKVNLITVHPTSPHISANQWITFNYRHLSKNVAGIDTNSTRWNGSKYVTKSNVFGKTASGIQNTLTRIVSMYSTAVETILTGYDKKITRDAEGFNAKMGNPHTCKEKDNPPKLNYEKISLWIKPVNQRKMDTSDDLNQTFISAYGKTNTNNYPLIYNYGANGRDMLDIFNDKFYYENSLCNEFNKYRLSRIKKESNSNYDEISDTYDVSNFEYYKNASAPELDITYRRYNFNKVGSPTKYLSLEEPYGNVYRWQPVINAMTKTGSSITEITIEDNSTNVTNAKNYLSGMNTLKQTRTFNADDIDLMYASSSNTVDYDLQTKYFYNDEHVIKNMEINLDNTDKNRFCINEFCGGVDGDIHNSGYPAMYTTPSFDNHVDTIKYGNHNNIRYFCTALARARHYGEIYSRVPSIQDCECGIPTPSKLSNVGGLSSKGKVSINTNENNAIPITRTTHYLYFKTWINTTFCMKVDVSIEATSGCTDETSTDENGNSTEVHTHGDTTTVEKTYWFNGKELVEDVNAKLNSKDVDLLDIYPDSEIKFGNANGLSEVYGEDNRGWGRCLSADDISNRQIKGDGTINTQKTDSGGLEVPVMVKYTPSLQPKLLAKTCCNKNKSSTDTTYLSLSSSNITLEKCRGQKNWLSSFVDGTLSDKGSYTQIETGQIDLKVAYPYIDEMNEYHTILPNGGNGGNVYFKDYYIDNDTDPSKSIDSQQNSDVATNMDFIGGNGICTAYTVILVPSNPILPDTSTKEYNNYFTNTDGHWNFFKQPANYYQCKDIFENVRAITPKNCGPVLVGYNLQPTEYSNTCEYLGTEWTINSKIPDTFIADKHQDKTFRGRNFQNISLNFTALRQGKFMAFKNDNFKNYSDAEELLGFELTSHNILQPGVIYDLVIIPVYSNRYITALNYRANRCGTINGVSPGGGMNEVFNGNYLTSASNSTGEVHLAGSNPLVLYNYFQIGSEIEINCGGGGTGGGGGGSTSDDEPDPSYIYDSDSAIIFPNVDNTLFNVSTGDIKESPGFWLNNSFKLILRMPSFRLKGKEYSHSDTYTIDNMSNGDLVTGTNTADDFEFSDIQIHIGKIEELNEYGYPDSQHLNLDKISDMTELAKAHIISYTHYGHAGMGVFSKKLSNYNVNENKDEDTRELLTAGSLDPTDDAYSHRFIEVNLSNAQIWDNTKEKLVPIYTLYPEGFYIQFRWKSKYAESQPEEHRWSDWYGGSYDGGLHWWGTNGTDYFVPIRNYSTLYTDFRNHIKESYPGSYTSMPIEPIEISEDMTRKIKAIVGKGSIMNLGSINEDSQNNPKDATTPSFYHVGVGNHKDALIVPSIEKFQDIFDKIKKEDTTDDKIKYEIKSISVSKNASINLMENNDNSYDTEYERSYSSISNDSIFNNHQQFWEMLYVDYIINNMRKLYYKPKYNTRDNELKFIPKNSRYNNNLYYHLSTPKSIRLTDLGWNKWNRNKYYRRIITTRDFDDLNKQLEDLVEFIRHPNFTGVNETNENMINEILPVSKNELSSMFHTTKTGIIGHSTSRISGLSAAQSDNNNINHTMMDSNYIQNIWQNILSVCRPSIQMNTKTNIELK